MVTEVPFLCQLIGGHFDCKTEMLRLQNPLVSNDVKNFASNVQAKTIFFLPNSSND